MFKKKNKIQEQRAPSIVLSPEFNRENEQNVQEQNNQQQYVQPIQNQPIQNQQVTQQINPVQQVQPIPIKEEVKEPEFVPVAVIVQGTITENDTFKYLVETNYPLCLGVCELRQ